MDSSKIILSVFGVFAAAYGWMLKHLFNKVQWKDTCQSERDCIESKLDGMTKLMNTRFDNLERLIEENGGKPRQPRIQT